MEDDVGVDGDGKYTGTVNLDSDGKGDREVDGEGNGLEEGHEEAQGSEYGSTSLPRKRMTRNMENQTLKSRKRTWRTT